MAIAIKAMKPKMAAGSCEICAEMIFASGEKEISMVELSMHVEQKRNDGCMANQSAGANFQGKRRRKIIQCIQGSKAVRACHGNS